MFKGLKNLSAKKVLTSLGKVIDPASKEGIDAFVAGQMENGKTRNNPISNNELINTVISGANDATRTTSLYMGYDENFKYDKSFEHHQNIKMFVAPTWIDKEKLPEMLNEYHRSVTERDYSKHEKDELFDELYLDYAITHPSKQVGLYGRATSLDVIDMENSLAKSVVIGDEVYRARSAATKPKFQSTDNKSDELDRFGKGFALNALVGIEGDDITHKTLYGTGTLMDNVYKRVIFEKNQSQGSASEWMGKHIAKIMTDNPTFTADQARELGITNLINALDGEGFADSNLREVLGIKKSLDSRSALVGVPQVKNAGTTHIRQGWDMVKVRDYIRSRPQDSIGLDSLTDLFVSRLDLEEMLKDFVEKQGERVEKDSVKIVHDYENSLLNSDFNPDSHDVAHDSIFRMLTKEEKVLIKTTKTTAKPLTPVLFKPILERIVRKVLKDIGQSLHSEKNTLSPIQTGERFFKFKSVKDFNEVNKVFGSAPNIEEAVYSTMERQIRSIIYKEHLEITHVSRTGVQSQIGIHELFESAIAETRGGETFDELPIKGGLKNLSINSIISMVRLQFDAFLSPLPIKPFKGNAAFFNKASSFFVATALGKLGLTSAVADGLMIGIFGQGILGKNSLKLMYDYAKFLTTELTPDQLDHLGYISESLRTAIFTDALGVSDTLLNLLTGIEHFTERGVTFVKMLLMTNLGHEIMNGEGDVVANLIKKGVLDARDIAYLKGNTGYLMGEMNGKHILSLTRLNRNAIENNIQLKIINYVHEIIPIHGLTSKAFAKAAHFMKNPIGFLVQAQMLFKGIILDHSKQLFFDPLIMGKRSGSVWGQMMFQGFIVSLGYQLIKHLINGQVPITDDKSDEKFQKARREILMTALLDSPMFGVAGSTLKALIDGDYTNPVSNMIPAHYGALAKIPLGLIPALTGDFGKAANKEISALNAFNPIHTMPAIGILFDRLITDGLRDASYADSSKYYQSLNTMVGNQGYKYLKGAKPDSIYGDK